MCTETPNPIIVGFVGRTAGRIEELSQRIGLTDPEALVMIQKAMEIQTEMMLMQMEGTPAEDLELLALSLKSTAESLGAAKSIDVLSALKQTWRRSMMDVLGIVFKLV